MNFKKISGYGIIMIALVFLFLFRPDKDQKNTEDLSHSPVSTPSPAKGIQNPEPADAGFSRIHCRIMKLDPVTIYSPVKGRIKYLVQKEDAVRKGASVASITRSDSNAEEGFPVPPGTDLFKEEIGAQNLQIQIAQEDISRLNAQINEQNNSLIEARYAFSTAKIDFDNGQITREKLEAMQEAIEGSDRHYKGLEEMRNGKYTDIDSYKSRISELETMIRNSSNASQDTVDVTTEFDGRVDTVFFRDNDSADEKLPLLTIMPSNVIFLEISGQIPFGADKKKAILKIEGSREELVGEIKLMGYKQEKDTEITSAWMMLQGAGQPENLIGKQGTISF